MPISHRHKCIFVHIPKTGGSSIEKYLDIRIRTKNLYRHSGHVKLQYNGMWYPLHHLPATHIKKIYPALFKKYYKFSFVRNPYQRILSLYLWLNDEKWQHLQNNVSDGNILSITKHFERWLDSFLKKNNYMKLTQTQFLYSKNKLIVDDVYKFENINSELERLKVKLNDNFNSNEIHNATVKSFDRNKLLTDAVKEKIYNFYKEDFDNFGYEK